MTKKLANDVKLARKVDQAAIAKGVSPGDLARLSEGKTPDQVVAALREMPKPAVEAAPKTKAQIAADKPRKPSKAERQAALKPVVIDDRAMDMGLAPAELEKLGELATLPTDQQVDDHFAAQQEAERAESVNGGDVVDAALAAAEPEMFATYADALKSAEAKGLKGFHIIRTDGGYTMTDKLEKPGKGKKTAKAEKPAPAPAPVYSGPKTKAYYVYKAEALAAAKEHFGAEAKDKVEFVLTKLARKDEKTGGIWYWVSMEQVDLEWGNRQRLDHNLKPKARTNSKPRASADKATTAERRSKAKAERKEGATGPTGMAAECMKLASRAKGVTPAELNEKTNWKGAPWKWLFSNPKNNGWCDRFGYTLEVLKDGKAVSYKVSKTAA